MKLKTKLALFTALILVVALIVPAGARPALPEAGMALRRTVLQIWPVMPSSMDLTLCMSAPLPAAAQTQISTVMIPSPITSRTSRSIRRAATAAKAAYLRAMMELLIKMEKLQPGEAAWEKADLKFHSAIAAASHNVIAIHIMEGLKASFNDYFKAKKFALGPERKDLLFDQHPGILAAIKQKNPPLARDRMTNHLEYVAEVIRRDFLKRGRKRRG